jgi:hypothetical protein
MMADTASARRRGTVGSSTAILTASLRGATCSAVGGEHVHGRCCARHPAVPWGVPSVPGCKRRLQLHKRASNHVIQAGLLLWHWSSRSNVIWAVC